MNKTALASHDDHFLFVEKYRPQTIKDCILSDGVRGVLQGFVDSGSIPNLLLYGSSGIGKTTAAIAMCEEIGLDYLLLNSSDERGIDTLRNKVMTYASSMSVSGGRKVIILDEADGLTADAQDALRGAMETFSLNCTFILTCNYKSKLSEAIHSRCAAVDFTIGSKDAPKLAAAVYHRLMEICDAEGIKYDKNALIEHVKRYFPDYRRIIGELQRLGVGGVVGAGLVASTSDDSKLIAELVKHLKDNNFDAMRKWVAVNSDMDVARIYKQLYSALYQHFVAATIPQAVVILAKYQYQAAFVADQEINTTACLTELMVDCEVK